MLRLEQLAKRCTNIQLPVFGAHISRARILRPLCAGKRLVASTPQDRLQQAQRAIEALSSMEQQQQTPVSTAVSEQNIMDVMQKTKSKRKHKHDLVLDEAQQEAIRQKIAASMARKAAKAKFHCPACGVTLTRVESVLTHMARCCEDLLLPGISQQVDSIKDTKQLQEILSQATTLENSKRRRALEITFLSPLSSASDSSASSERQNQQQQDRSSSSAAVADAGSTSSDEDEDVVTAAAGGDVEEGYEGGYSKQTRQRIHNAPADIAKELGVPVARAERLLRQAMRTVPIAVDTTTQLDVVYEDTDFIAVNKPVGYHTAPIHRWQGGSMVNILLGHLQKPPAAANSAQTGQQYPSTGPGQHTQQAAGAQELKQHQPHAKPYVVHRLDYNTSGVLLFGKRREVVPGVSAQFRERRVSKEYVAITVGVPEQRCFTVNAPIDKHPQHDTARCIAQTGKAAVTHVEVISVNPNFDLTACPGFSEGELFHERGGSKGSQIRGVALVRCFPRSGRTHQIRLHMAHVGHPLVGDEVYGVTGNWIGRQALHARALQLTHPLTGETLRFVAPLHDDFRQALDMLGLDLPDDAERAA